MIAAVDSAYPPTASSVQQAKAAGVQVWSGYLASKANVGLLHPWSRADFDVARGCGGTPIAFCSGNDDPGACKALAQAWNVRLCLDVEGGIRGDGPWVQPWLNASGAGLYGNQPVFNGRTAPFFVMAGYYGSDPGATWRGAAPGVPHGWQWQGTTSMFGASVDRTWLDDWFGTHPQGAFMALTDQQQTDMYTILKYIEGDRETAAAAFQAAGVNESPWQLVIDLKKELDEVKAKVATMQAGAPSGPLKVTLTGTAQP